MTQITGNSRMGLLGPDQQKLCLSNTERLKMQRIHGIKRPAPREKPARVSLIDLAAAKTLQQPLQRIL